MSAYLLNLQPARFSQKGRMAQDPASDCFPLAPVVLVLLPSAGQWAMDKCEKKKGKKTVSSFTSFSACNSIIPQIVCESFAFIRDLKQVLFW